MKVRELQEMGDQELVARLSELRSALVHVRDEIRAGKEKNHAQLRDLRRDIARVQTVLSQKRNQADVK